MKQQDKEAGRGGEEEYLPWSFLPGALPSYTFKHLSSPNLRYHFATGSLDTKYQVFISSSAPMHEWHQHDYLFLHKKEELSAEITASLSKKTKTKTNT